MEPVAAERRDPLRVVALVVTLALHAGVLGAMYVSRLLSSHHEPQLKEAYVDAQLVRFGKPRDLSFLPHKHGRVKDKPPDLKIAKDGTVYIVKTPFKFGDDFEKALKGNAKLQAEGECYVHADQALPYGDVVKVMAALSRNGGGKIGLVTYPLK